MADFDQSKIRNFCIIAHIDHGKSTLADRIIEMTGLLTEREMQSQVLDNMDLERERGITIKAQTVRTVYKAKDGEEYIFNLIDTPGHVDFNYEVSRSLAACDGAILVVDAAQGIEAQTLANVYLALDHDLDVMPVINKIDLPSAEPERVINEIEDVIGIEAQDAPQISAKTGLNVEEVLEQIVEKVPAPTGDPHAPLQALIFDSVYDSYKGVIVFCRIKEGKIRKGTTVRMMATGAVEDVVEVGYFGAGQFIPCEELSAGMVGYFTASIKNVKDTRVGDTVTDNSRPCSEPLPGYKKVNPMVYCGVYPADGAKYGDLRDALEKLQLNDASLQYEPETSIALGFGFRCGFLGLLHLEIIQERLEREYNLDLVCEGPDGDGEEDYEAQNEMIDRAIREQVDALLFSAIDFEKNAEAIDRAAKAGIRIVVVDSPVNSEAVECYIGTNNYEAGCMAGEEVLGNPAENLNIGIVNFDKSTENGQLREKGFRDTVLNDDRANITASINVKSTITDAREGTERMLLDNPQINVIVTFNEWTTLGVGDAVEALGAGERTQVVAFDSNVKSIGMLEKGNVDALIVQNPYAMGYLGIEQINTLLNGQKPEKKETATSSILVTRENMYDDKSQKALFSFEEK